MLTRTPENSCASGICAVLAAGFGTLKGWWRNVAAILLGVSLTLAMPPIYFLPFLFVAFTGLFWLTSSASSLRRAFLDGWWFGLGFFVSGLYWITNALLVDADKFGWLAPFAVIGISSVLALYIGILAVMLRKTSDLPLLSRVLLMAMGWSALEWLRGMVLTGFPWNLLGYVWTFAPETMQPAAWIGTYGLGFVTGLLALLPVLFTGCPIMQTRERRTACAVILLAASLLFGAGAWRIPEGPVPMVPGVMLRVVQGNIAQSMKWDPEKRIAALRTYAELSRGLGVGNITTLIWSESAVTMPFLSGDGLARELATLVPEKGYLLTGTTRLQGSRETGDLQAFNALYALNGEGDVAASYDKHKLVPFGEFAPLRHVLPLDKITPGALDFSAGPLPAAMALDGLPEFWPLICYEAVFPGLASGAHPAWLLNITNDAWFGTSTGPYQHFAMSRMRAVEQGVALIRAANTGISAVVDPYGRVVKSLPLNAAGVIDSGLPSALGTDTLYGRFGDVVLLLLLFASGLYVAVQYREINT